MLRKYKLTAIEWLNNPSARTIFILSTLLVVALVGGAPSDGGGM